MALYILKVIINPVNDESSLKLFFKTSILDN